jgi:hypothetical protein
MSAMRKLPVVLICHRPHALRRSPDTPHIDAVPCPTRGALRDRHDVGRGMRWTRAMSATIDVDPRTAKSCGPDAPTLASSFAEVFSRGDGGKKARSPGRARYKP